MVIVAPAIAQEPVYFPDPNLKAAVEDALWLYDPTPADMLSLREFSCIRNGVRDITGLEWAENLQVLNLRFNHISDISPLSELSGLQDLSLSRNQIDGLSALSGLTKLRHLDLHGNQLSEISVLSGLTNLRTLILRFNELSDITALSGLYNLQHLDFHDNRLHDISPLSGLTNLRNLDLYDNQIGDITALSGMTELEYLDLRLNQVHDISVLDNLTGLTHLYLGRNQISTLTPLTHLMRLRDLYVSHNQITDISALLGLTELHTVDLRWNPMNTDFFCGHLDVIIQNNPGIICFYDGDCATPMPSTDVPAVSRDSAAHITESSAVLQAHVVSDGAEACEGRFRYWLPGQNETTTAWQSSLYAGAVFTQAIRDLQPNSQYNFAVELRNSVGTDVSGMGSFMTTGQTFVLTILSSPGGTVVDPGPGDFSVPPGTSVPVTARPAAGHCLFNGWTGTAVDAGAVDDPHAASTYVLVEASCTLQANFLENIIYVDDDAPFDPQPHDMRAGDPQEDGSADHPFDSIQEAIAAASPGALVLVRSGTFCESVDLMGKPIHVTGIDPSHPEITAWPVLNGSDMNTIVAFSHGEDPRCQLSGFVLTGGRDKNAAAIACWGSSPTIRNCLIVGNRCDDPCGAIIDCQDGSPVFENLTVHGNDAGDMGAAFRFVNCHAVVANSILWDNQPREIVVESGDDPLVSYSNVSGTWPGPGNTAVSPDFAWPGYWSANPGDPQTTWVPGNYHLMSQSGRWDQDSLTWASDGLTSACIDAGDPDWPFARESFPNGKRINMGAYGETARASRSSLSILAHWRFDESSGATAVDSVGYNDGRVHGAAWASGKMNGALSFDGADDYVDCGRHPGLAPEEFTLSLWIYPQADSASRTVLQKGGPDAEDYRFELFGAQHPTFSFGNGADNVVLYSDSVLTREEWVHVALTRAGTEAALYINGTRLMSEAYSSIPSATNHPLVIGGTASCHYQGKIDDLRIYGLALSEEDIRGLVAEAQ